MRLLTLDAVEVARWTAPAGSGTTRLRLCEPVTRHYTADGRLAGSTPGGARAVVDVIELTPDEARALTGEEHAPPPPMVVLGSFTALGGADTLGRFLVGGAVLDTNLFDGHRCPSEQTALGLWRIARLRGGAFWEGVADLIASWTEGRIASATGVGPVHGLWGHAETHVRFLADAALLLAAAGRSPAAERAVTFLDRFALPFGGGRWYVHDSLELATGSPDLVVNTHAQVVAVLAATGRATGAAVHALEAALAARPRRAARPAAAVAAAALGASDLVGSRGPVRLRGRAEGLARWAQGRIAHGHAATPAVRLPGGYLARDASRRPAPHYYAGVNLYDLGLIVANGVVAADGRSGRAFRAALRWASATGSFDVLRRSGTGIACLEPIVWQQAGRLGRALDARTRLVDAGFVPAPGWPGHLDAPWRAFSAGTA